MAHTKRPANRLNRIDPSLPKTPPLCPVAVSIVTGKVTLTSAEPLTYNAALGNVEEGNALPGVLVTNAAGGHLPSTVTLSAGDTVATLDVQGGTVAATGVTVTMTGFVQALRSQRGGQIVIGRSTF